MGDKDTGGPAFPNIKPCQGGGAGNIPNFSNENGMTLRDHFAGKALPNVITECVMDNRQADESYATYCARKSYEMADAMIAERNK